MKVRDIPVPSDSLRNGHEELKLAIPVTELKAKVAS